MGYILPAYIDWYPLPDDLYYRLPPAPYGCRYILVNGDIVLIAVPSGLVLDALLVLFLIETGSARAAGSSYGVL